MTATTLPPSLRAALLAATLLPPLAHAGGRDDPLESLAAVPPLAGVRSPAPAPCLPAAPDQPLGLVDAVDIALCNNPQTRQAWAAARAQAALVGVAQSAYLPTIAASAGASRNRNDAATGTNPATQRTAGLSLSYVLYDFGARAAGLENARQLFDAAAASRDAAVQGLFLAAVQAYFQRQAAAAALEASRLSEKASLESLHAAEARYQVGAATPADRLQARTAHAQATLNRITAEGAASTAHGTLANVLGTDPTRPLALQPLPPAAPDAAFSADVAQLIADARTRRPDLIAAEAQFRAAQAGVDAARAGHLPTLALGVAAGRSHATGAPGYDSSNIGLTLTIPLFSGFSTTYKVHAAQAQADLQAARRDQVRLQVALDVWNAHANLVTATQSVKTASELLDSATQSEKVAAGRYRAGVGSILDLLTAQAALAAARQSRIQAGTGWYVSRATLAQAMGALDAELLSSLSPAPAPASAPRVLPSARGSGE